MGQLIEDGRDPPILVVVAKDTGAGLLTAAGAIMAGANPPLAFFAGLFMWTCAHRYQTYKKTPPLSGPIIDVQAENPTALGSTLPTLRLRLDPRVEEQPHGQGNLHRIHRVIVEGAPDRAIHDVRVLTLDSDARHFHPNHALQVMGDGGNKSGKTTIGPGSRAFFDVVNEMCSDVFQDRWIPYGDQSLQKPNHLGQIVLGSWVRIPAMPATCSG